jgi:thymidylate kinase
MYKNGNLHIVFDGHDGTGKTTLSQQVADYCGGIYVRPFGGQMGLDLIEAYENKDHQLTIELGFKAIERIDSQYQNSILVFDRHWMTVLSLLEPNYWSILVNTPPTILCWADLQNTKNRLSSRPEKQYSDEYHTMYLNIYKTLAASFGAFVLDTSNKTLEDSFTIIKNWLHTNNIYHNEHA